MKTLNALLFTACAILIVAGCLSGYLDNTPGAPSANAITPSLKKSHADNSVPISGEDAKFAVDAANGSMTKVILGELARQKTNNNAIRNVARMMVTDHLKGDEEIKKVAADKKVILPESINSKGVALRARLAKKSGIEFDKAYVSVITEDHKEDIQAFEEAVTKVKYPEIRAFIRKTIPLLKKHLAALEKIREQLR